MHLKKRPTWFVKEGIRRPVYYTVDARQLSQLGWVPEEEAEIKIEAKTEKVIIEINEEPETEKVTITGVAIPITSPQPAQKQPEPVVDASEYMSDLHDMTKAELIAYAKENDITIDSSSLKATILEACLSASEHA